MVTKLNTWIGLVYVKPRFCVMDILEFDKQSLKLFSKRAKSLDSIPPTIASLEQHVKRAVFQGGYVWG